MSSIYFDEQDKYVMERLFVAIVENHQRGGPKLTQDAIAQMAEEIRAKYFGVPEHHAVYDTRTHVAVPFKTVDDFHVKSVLALDENCATTTDDLALDVEEWSGELVATFYGEHPGYWMGTQEATNGK